MKWLKKIIARLKTAILKIDIQMKIILPIGISVVEKVKAFVDSPLADVVTAIIPGEFDDRLKNILRTFLPNALLQLRNWKELEDITDQEEKLKAIILEIGVGTGILTKEERNDLKTRLAASINSELSGINYSEIKLATLTAYLHPEILKDEAA